MAKYLDEQGLRTLWGKIKEKDTALDTKLSTAISNETTNRNSAIAQAKADVKNELLGGAGAALDTLKELETALGKDPNFATTITNKVGTVQNNFDAHKGNTSNPHGVTKAQVGLSAVVNTGDSATPVANGTTKFTTGGAYTLKNDLINALSTKETELKNYTNNAVKDCVSKYGTYQGSNTQDSYAISFDSGIFKINLTNKSTGPITGQGSKAFEVSYASGIKFDNRKLLDSSDVQTLSTSEIEAILV